MPSLELETIISKKVLPLKCNNSIADVLSSMSQNNISSVVIVDENNIPVGIFTEHDSLKIVTENIDVSQDVCTVMTTELFTIRNDVNINDAYLEMDKEGLKHLIVIDMNGKYCGVVTQGDFLRKASFKHIDLFKSISDITLSSPLTIDENISVMNVAQLLKSENTDFVVILNENKPKALLTQRDISRYITQNPNHDLQNIDISTIQTQKFHFLYKSSSIREAVILMENAGVHQLVIVNDSDELVGVITRHDVLEALYGSYFKYLLETIEIKNLTLQELQKNKDILDLQTTFLNNILNTIPDLIWIKDLNGKYLTCNHIFQKLYNKSLDDIIGKTDYDLVDKNLADFFTADDLKTIQVDSLTKSEHYLNFVDGSHKGLYEAAKTPIRSSDGQVIGVLGIAHDITLQREREKELERMANYDTLTNLPNRSLLKYHLNLSMVQSKRTNLQVALVLFDLDKFKDINDSYGHSLGDELLVAVAKRFSYILREEDIVTRLGGDEFALVIDKIDNIEDVAKIVNKLIKNISEPYIIKGLEIHIGMSAGIAMFPKNADTVETLLQYADSALYKAKNDGRGNYRFYDDNMTSITLQHLECENRMRKALKNNEFEVYYQPQIDMHTNKIVGAEALLRWNCPIDGLVMPSIFIPIAEETGLIAEVGEFVLNQTCRDGKKWQDKGYDLRLAVNVSSNQLKYQNIPKMIDTAIKESGLHYHHLEIELTESAIMERATDTIEMLNSLKEKGVFLAIDDFGTGYSSLSYLKLFPIDVLKIDKSFVDDILYKDDSKAIVIAIIAMAKALGYKVLAEGTEHIEQIEFLKENGCDMYQGYYKSQPIPALEFEKLLEAK